MNESLLKNKKKIIVISFICILILIFAVIFVFKTKDTSSSQEVSSTTENADNNKQTIPLMNLNETIHTQDWEITLKGTEFSQDVYPPITSGFYTHYQIEDTNNTYLVAKFDIKNISTIPLSADKNISLKAIYDGKYEYSGFSVLLKKDNTGFDYVNITSIPPLTNRTLYYLLEMPKSISEDNKPISIQLTTYQDTYTYTISKSNTPNIETEPKESQTTSSNTSKTPAKVATTSKKKTSSSDNPYEETVVYSVDVSSAERELDFNNYVENNISNQPIPTIYNYENDDTDVSYLRPGIAYKD